MHKGKEKKNTIISFQLFGDRGEHENALACVLKRFISCQSV